MRQLYLFVLFCLGNSFCLFGQNKAQYPAAYTITQKLGDIPALSTLQLSTPPAHFSKQKTWKRPNYFFSNDINNANALPQNGDPLVHKNNNPADVSGPELLPLLSFDGMVDEDGISPPDPTGDAGPNHYVQMVNSGSGARMQVFNKQGVSVLGPVYSSLFWDMVGGASIGDPIVQYDHSANRWLIMEMQNFGENQLLIAVSDTDDPTGSWKAWRIQCVGFPDYPKLYVWDNAYFVTVNEIVEDNQCTGYALDKTALLNGASEVGTYRFVMPNFNAIRYQPATGADWEGGPPPPPGSPGMIFRVYDDGWDGGKDQIHLWEINVDWFNAAGNFAAGPTTFDVAPFETRVCYGPGLFNCIEQPGTATRITALENIIMYRAPYRNFGTHESVVFNHVSDVSNEVGDGGDAAVRWYELRRDAGQPDWYVHQQGTYAPDPVNRFMGTLSMDGQGNIGLGYTVASASVFPGIRLTGRRQIDPLGEMTIQEHELIPGTASHVGDNRWGDYSSMAIDPADDKTFWFTAQYQSVTGNWSTRIGTFQIRRDSFDVAPVALVAPQSSATLNTAQVTARISNGGVMPATGIQADVYVNNAFFSTNTVAGTLLPGASTNLTFTPSLTWTNVLDQKEITVVTRWPQDNYRRNDTLTQVVQKLTSFDAGLGGLVELPGLVCAASKPVGVVVRNTSGLPLDSVQVRWVLNQADAQNQQWYGPLAPGQQDTAWITLNGILPGQNTLNVTLVSPNGQTDQNPVNNAFSTSFAGYLGGAYFSVFCRTDQGNLTYELLENPSNVLVDQGFCNTEAYTHDICVADGQCYTLRLRAGSVRWEGFFQLKDWYGNVLASITAADPVVQNIPLCAPVRKTYDVGVHELLSPVSGNGLTTAETVSLVVRNYGQQKVGNFQVGWRLDTGNWNYAVFTDSIAPGADGTFTFTNSFANVSTPGNWYQMTLATQLPNDEIPNNDTMFYRVKNRLVRDVGIYDLSERVCARTDNNYVILSLVNEGVTPITEVSVKTVSNGQSGEDVYYMDFFNPGDTFGIYLFLPEGVLGTNTLDVQVTQVNGLSADDYPADNAQQKTFFVDPTKFSVSISLAFDKNAEESSWELRSSSGTLLDQGGNYPNGYGYDFRNYCFDQDSCFIFTLFDSAGNGSDGYFNILTNNWAAWSYNGQTDTFTNQIVVPFCAPEQCLSLQMSTSVTHPSNGPLNNGAISVSATGGTGPYQYALDNVEFGPGNLFSGLTPGMYKVKVLDSKSCYDERLVQVGTTGTDQVAVVQRRIQLRPNPTLGPVWFTMPALGDEQNLSGVVTDAHGRVVREIGLTRYDATLLGNFSLQQHPAGVYWLGVYNQNGQKIAEKRIQKI